METGAAQTQESKLQHVLLHIGPSVMAILKVSPWGRAGITFAR